jgi:hypothetical protein
MKKMKVHIEISSGRNKSAQIDLEKIGPDKEIDVLTSALQTIFIKSKEALKIAEKKIKKQK